MTRLPSSCDLLVVGAGPAGATVATLFKKYRPKARVVLVEKSAFPRHRIGESLLPASIPILRELGVHDKIDAAGFVRKVGVTFVWGKDRRPWDADFSAVKMAYWRKFGRKLDLELAWQVERSRYDEVLLKHAVSQGVEAFTRTAAVAPLFDGKAVCGAVLRGPDGKAVEVRARHTADCTGQAAFLSGVRGGRVFRKDLRNVAAYGYFRGARWKYRYSGHPDKSRIFVCSRPEGWFWFIPISRDLVSVGLVSKASDAAAAGDRREFFFSALKRCREIWPLVRGARLERGMDAAQPERDFFTAADWSYSNRHTVGDGWIAAGDAAFFLDPLLSSGVLMAHLSGQRAAYTLLTADAESDPGVRRSARADHERFCREVASSFADLVGYWYAHDPNATAWRKVALAGLRRRSPYALGERNSFAAAAAGVDIQFEAGHLNRALGGWTNRPDRLWTVPTGDRDNRVPLIFAARGAGRRKERARAEADPSRAYALRGPARTSVVWMVVAGTGTLGPIRRVTFTGPDGAVMHRMLPRALAAAARLFDGRRTLAEVEAAIAARAEIPAHAAAAQFRFLVADLLESGLLVEAGAGAPRRPRVAGRLRAELLLLSGDAAGAQRLLSSGALARDRRPWTLALRAEAARASGRVAEALKGFDRALAAAESAAGGAGAGTAGRLARADAELERGWIVAEILCLRADARLQARDRDGALADADRVSAAEPGHRGAMLFAGKARAATPDSWPRPGGLPELAGALLRPAGH